LARPLARLLADALLLAAVAADRVARIAVALTGAPLLPIGEAEARDVDLRDRDRDQVLPLASDQLPLRDVLAEVLPDAPADDAAEPRVVLVDLQRHRGSVYHAGFGLQARFASSAIRAIQSATAQLATR